MGGKPSTIGARIDAHQAPRIQWEGHGDGVHPGVEREFFQFLNRETHTLVHFQVLLSAKLLLDCNISRARVRPAHCAQPGIPGERRELPQRGPGAEPRPKLNVMHFRCHRTDLVKGIMVPCLCSSAQIRLSILYMQETFFVMTRTSHKAAAAVWLSGLVVSALEIMVIKCATVA